MSQCATSSHTQNQNPNPHLRAKDAAAYCGIALSTFWRWVKDGRITPGVRLSSRCTIWPQSALDDFIAENSERKEA